MEWLHTFLSKNEKSIINSGDDCDPQACYDSFKEHWQQALKIISRAQNLPSHDDVLGVVNHLEQMVHLLLYDIKKHDANLCLTHISSSKCLEYLLSENILHKIFEWSIKSGQYNNAVRYEQLKFYEMLIAQTRHTLLMHDPFMKPLIRLLCSCQNEIFSIETEKLLVDLLNQLSALLMQNPDFIDLFFYGIEPKNRFVIFSLLIKFVHREDSIGMRARDALLLCMSLSKKNQQVKTYIAEQSNFAVLVASGLSGLYSELPNILDDIIVPDWHRFTPDDVNEIKDLLTFVTSLEFSNAVAQVAHPVIRKQLQEFLYRGFLIPVLGPALLQSHYEAQVAATAYLEVILRTVTQPGLLHSLLQFLLKMEYDGQRLLNILIQRIQSNHVQLSLVSLAVFESLVDLNCEDLMLELTFKHLQPSLHLMISQQQMFLPLDPLCQSFEKLLALAPQCCQILINDKGNDAENTAQSNNNNFPSQWKELKSKQSLYGKYYAYLCDARSKIARCQMDCVLWNNSYAGTEDIDCEVKDNSNNNSLLEKSSGYESLNIADDSNEVWKMSSVTTSRVHEQCSSILNDSKQLETSASAGPFLTTLMEKLKNYLSNTFYVNLHLTGLISRLAVYPQPILRAYLLDHTLILQPNVPSLFEIIASLKQKIDEYMSKHSDSSHLLKYAKDCLIDREIVLVNLRRYHIEQQNTSRAEARDQQQQQQQHSDCSQATTFVRGGPKRRSLNIQSLTNMFGRRPSQIDANNYPSVVNTASDSPESHVHLIYPKFNEGQHVALCAVLLDEWVKELAALAQEHTIAQIATLLK